MAKLNKKQITQLEYALRNAQRANDYLMAANIAIARKGDFATTTLHYTRQYDNASLYEVEKNYGSDLTGLFNAIETIKTLIINN